MSDDPTHVTRRELLRSATLLGTTAVAAPASLLATTNVASAAEAPKPPAREAFENLTAQQSDLLEAIVERLIPSDANGPGAKDARVAHFIDRALGGALATSRSSYAAGLAALDRYSSASRGKPFLELSATDQDSVLMDCESGAATGFTGSSAFFFGMLLNHTRQGMFGDPYYGGNANFAGWELVGYPGVRTAFAAADQKALEANQLKPNYKSAYDFPTFNKATAHLDAHDAHHSENLTQIDGAHHGD